MNIMDNGNAKDFNNAISLHMNSNYQLELIKSDIEDVQNIILDVTSRIGPLRQTSWKFPDSNGYDLDIPDLLRKYSLSDEEDDSLIIQTALLELLVDRFLLLLHALTSYVDNYADAKNVTDSKSTLNSKSAGITARQYWRKLVVLLGFLSDLQRSAFEKESKINTLETQVKEMIKAPVKLKMHMDNEAKPVPVKPEIAMETSVKGTQTLDTAFRPCEACATVQEGFRSILDTIVAITSSQNVPSSVVKFKRSYETMKWLSTNDLQRLLPELFCDLDKIQRQWIWLYSQLDPLKQELEGTLKELDSTKQELRLKNSNLMTIGKSHEKKVNDLGIAWSVKEKNYVSQVSKSREDIENLTLKNEKFQLQIDSLQKAVAEKERLVEDFRRLQMDLDGLSTESQVLNEHLAAVTTERDLLQNSLISTKDELNRANMLAESMRSRCETLQTKQDTLLEEMSSLDKTSDEYRIKMSNLEGQLDATRDHLDEKRKEIEKLKQNAIRIELELDHFKRHASNYESHGSGDSDKEVSKLQEKVHDLQKGLMEYRQKEMLLLAFPDPNGPLPFSEPTGDICLDLERQISATETRSQLLQQQAFQLSKSLRKLREAQQPKSGQLPGELDPGESLKTDGNRPTSSTQSASIRDNGEPEGVDNFEYDLPNTTVPVGKKNSRAYKDREAIQLWRVPASLTLKEEPDPVSAALAAYAKQADGLSSNRSRSNSYSRPNDANKPEKTKRDATLALPQLPNLPTCSAAATKPTTAPTSSTLASRASTRQLSLAAEIRFKTRIASAGKQRKKIPPQPPSSPLGIEAEAKANDSGLKWDLYSCPNCSKTYGNQRDLDIHSAYCNNYD